MENPLPPKPQKKKPCTFRLGAATLEKLKEMERQGYDKTELIEHAVDYLHRAWRKSSEK